MAMTPTDKIILIIWIVGTILMRYHVKAKSDSDEDGWSDVFSGYAIGVIWPVVLMLKLFFQTKPPKWL